MRVMKRAGRRVNERGTLYTRICPSVRVRDRDRPIRPEIVIGSAVRAGRDNATLLVRRRGDAGACDRRSTLLERRTHRGMLIVRVIVQRGAISDCVQRVRRRGGGPLTRGWLKDD